MAPDPYRYFRVEAGELLEQLGQGALDLEKGAPAADMIARLLRLTHTLKGAARVVKQPQIAEHAHQLEELLSAVRDTTGRPAQEQIDRILTLLDRIGVGVAALKPGEAPAVEARQAAAAQEPLYVLRPEAADLDALTGGVAQAQTHLGALRPRLVQADRIRHLIELVDSQLARLRGRAAVAAAEHSRIEEARSMIEELRGRFAALERGVAAGIDAIDRELRQVGEASARLRLIPASAIFRFLERAVRDAAQALGKRVTFEGRGGEVRVDSGILAILQPALLQVVRNAVAHGIEPSERERRDAGKPVDGSVVLEVSRRGKWVSFTCSDDGRGVDVDAVRRILQRKGLWPAGPQPIDTDALLGLLLKGGISTSGTVTDVAGRGIGLDVVREAAERLGGDLRMRSDPGKGTTIELRVPFAVASLQALLVEVEGVALAVPLDAVRRTFRIGAGDVVATASGDAILRDGKSIPVASLGHVIRPTAPHRRPLQPASAFLVEADDRAAAFTVNRILGTGNVVTRPLPDLAPAAACVAGASLDPGGHPRLVLDPSSLVSYAHSGRQPQADPTPSRRAILVIDDSLTTRMLEQSILESAGYDVTLASSGEEGLEKARRGGYALFLVDVEMPGMDGFAFIEQVRADPTLRDVPSILVTSRVSAEDRQRGRDVGAQGYIVKSDFDQSALLERIRALVR